MASHISQRPRAKLPPAPPVKRRQVFNIIRFLSCTQKQVPMQSLGNGWLFFGPGYALGPDGPVRPAIYFLDIANNACFKPFPHGPYAIAGGALVSHLSN